MASTITTQDETASDETASETETEAKTAAHGKQQQLLLPFPGEVRLAIYDLAEPDPVLVLPHAGPLFPALDGLSRASKASRSEIFHRKLEHVTWTGRTTTKTWRKFKTAIIPHIKHLTIEVMLPFSQLPFKPKRCDALDAIDLSCVWAVREILTWVFWRNKSFLKAKCAWRLDELILVPMCHEWRIHGLVMDSDDSDSSENSITDTTTEEISHWSELPAAKKLLDSGMNIRVEGKIIRPSGSLDSYRQ